MKLLSPVTSKVLLPIAALFLLSRALLLAALEAAVTYLPPKPQTRGIASLLCHWDCIWYLSVADIGYTQREIPQGSFAMTNYCFSPLLPLAMRLLAPLFHGNILYAGVAFTNLCFFAALIYVYRYARLLDYSRNVALLSVALLCFLPQSIAFSAVLSESPYLLLLAMAIFHSRRGDWLAAGIAAALLSATRSNGVLFVVFALALALRSDGIRGLLAPWRAPEKFIPLVFAPLGLFVFWAWCFAATGDAFAQVSAEEHGWNWHFYPIWENVVAMVHAGGQPFYVAISGSLTLACTVLLLRAGLFEEFAFCCAAIVLILSGSGVVSIFRYWIVLFPVWVVVAGTLARRPLLAAAVFLAFGLLNAVLIAALALRNPLSL